MAGINLTLGLEFRALSPVRVGYGWVINLCVHLCVCGGGSEDALG